MSMLSDNVFYDVRVDNNSSYYPPNTTNYNWGLGNFTYAWPQTIYMYQLRCPACDTLNWCELDKTIVCSDCEATLKAVLQKVDYEIKVK